MALSKYEVKINEHGEETLDRGSPAFPVACYHDDLKVDPVPWHWHEQIEFAVVTEGQIVIDAGKEKLQIAEGDGFFINANILHTVVDFNSKTCRLHSMVFMPRLVAGGVDSIYWQKYVQPLVTDKCLSVLHLKLSCPWENALLEQIEKTWQILVNEPAGFEFQVRENLSRMIYSLYEQRPGKPAHPSEKALRDGERIKKMLLYIQENYADAITVTNIANSALISESECLRCFRNTIGVSPIQYLKQHRIQKAADYLHASALPIAEIASRCGFQEMSYFAKSFKELRGVTPSEYRKKLPEH